MVTRQSDVQPTNPEQTMDAQHRSDPEHDFTAAMYEVRSNLEVRRLMLVVSQVFVPALAMAVTDCLSGSEYPPELAWLPRHIVVICGVAIALSGTVITTILARCHFGLVVNSGKLRHVLTGTIDDKPLNRLGVTTNFTALTGLSAAAGLSLALASFGLVLPLIAGPLLVVLLVYYLHWTHRRANRRCGKLAASWQHGRVPLKLQEEQARLSLEDTTSDISIVVTMGVALFAGTFNSMTNVGGIPAELQLTPSVASIKAWGVAALSGFTLASLLLSQRMVVRLRIALAKHSATLARLRDEPDDPYQFSPRERTFLLFLLLQLIACTCALILFWSLLDVACGLFAAAGLMLLGLFWYPRTLSLARSREVAKRQTRMKADACPSDGPTN